MGLLAVAAPELWATSPATRLGDEVALRAGRPNCWRGATSAWLLAVSQAYDDAGDEVHADDIGYAEWPFSTC